MPISGNPEKGTETLENQNAASSLGTAWAPDRAAQMGPASPHPRAKEWLNADAALPSASPAQSRFRETKMGKVHTGLYLW